MLSCATYYQKYISFNRSFEKGNLQEADKHLADDKKAPTSKTKLLYYLNRGAVQSILGNYYESNQFLEQAYLIVEDYQINYAHEALSYLTNPQLVAYKGEDHEKLLLHYYKAMNYMKLNQYEEALVECKRMNIKLGLLSGKYKKDNAYKEDAFIHLLMGLIYDANKDYNNAFIAYRNALNIFESSYHELFGIEAPTQLKKDILRTAYQTGLHEELRKYEDQFNMLYKPHQLRHAGDLLFFWHNGLGPVKAEWGITFSIIRGEGGLVTFTNDDYGFSFPFVMNEDDDEPTQFNDIEFIRVTFPKYVARPAYFDQAQLSTSLHNKKIPLEKVQDITAISFKCLEERMLKEFSKSLLRVALKKATEYSIRAENEEIGTAIGIINALTEKTDTRNWQSLPHAIYYTRVMLPEGKHTIDLHLNAQQGSQQKQVVQVDIVRGRTTIQSFHSLESKPYNFE